MVCMGHGEEPDLEILLSDGLFVYGENSTLKKGLPISCHENSGNLWNKNRNKINIMTGYVLSNDGMWRQHTWCLQKADNLIIETTEKRIAYYGYILNKEQSENFYKLNC